MIIHRFNPIGLHYLLSSLPDGKTTHISLINSNPVKSIVVNCHIDDMSQRWFNWQQKGDFIQDAFSNLNADEREFLLTGITREEWTGTFDKDEE